MIDGLLSCLIFLVRWEVRGMHSFVEVWRPMKFKCLIKIRYNIYFHIGYTLLLGNLSDRIEALPTDAWLYPAACLRSSDSLSQTKRCSAGESLSSLTTRFAYSRESDECLLARIQRSGFRLSNLRRDGAPTRCSAMLWQFGERCPNAYCVWFPDCFRTWRDDHDPRRRARPAVLETFLL